MCVFSSRYRLTGDGQIGQMEKMDGKNPTLSIQLPDGSKLVSSSVTVFLFSGCLPLGSFACVYVWLLLSERRVARYCAEQ